MAIYITGDIHCPIDIHKLTSKCFPDKDMTKNDYLIICGDTALVWDGAGHDGYWQNWFERKNFTTLWVDGNHECMNKETDILTEHGWVNIKQYVESKSDYKVATVDLHTHQLVFEEPLRVISKYSPTIVNIIGQNYKQSVTPNHDILLNGRKTKARNLIHKIIPERQFVFNISEQDYNIDISPKLIEVLTSIVMDATIVDYNKRNPNSHKVRVQYHLKKERKIQYIKDLLSQANLHYTVRKGMCDDTFICLYGDDARHLYRLLEFNKQLPQYFRNLNRAQFQALRNAINQTDGTLRCNCTVWRTTSQNDIDIVQELCVKHNYEMTYQIIEDGSGYSKTGKRQYHCSFGKKELHRNITVEEIPYHDIAYCLTMSKGTLVTRYKGGHVITGNCHQMLNEYPVSEWHGSKVHFIKPSVIHLMRGQVFDIDGSTFLTLGGAQSHDKEFRTEGLDWWQEEEFSKEDYNETVNNISRYNFKVDFVVSHDCPAHVVKEINLTYRANQHTHYLEQIWQQIEYKKWYFGHHHIDRALPDNMRCLYNDVIEVR